MYCSIGCDTDDTDCNRIDLKTYSIDSMEIINSLPFFDVHFIRTYYSENNLLILLENIFFKLICSSVKLFIVHGTTTGFTLIVHLYTNIYTTQE